MREAVEEALVKRAKIVATGQWEAAIRRDIARLCSYWSSS